MAEEAAYLGVARFHKPHGLKGEALIFALTLALLAARGFGQRVQLLAYRWPQALGQLVENI